MAYDHFRPPEHFSPRGKILFRLLCIVTVIVIMTLFAYFAGPLIDRYVGNPLADTVTDWIFGPKDASAPQ